MTTGEPPVITSQAVLFNELKDENDGKGNIKPITAGYLFFFGQYTP